MKTSESRTAKHSADMSRRSLPLVMTMVATLLCLAVGSPATAKTADVPTAWRLLDYVPVNYRGAVSGGHVKSATEFAEMTEFAQ